MVLPHKGMTDESDCPSPDLVAVSADKDSLFVAALGKGIYRKRPHAEWSRADDGFPEGVVVNRLQSIDGSVYACTNKGLFYFDEQGWFSTEIAFPCYQVSKQGVFFAAATEYGLWCKIGTRWENTAYPNMAVYDLLFTPQYYTLGFHRGISLYDRWTGSGTEFPFGTAITSLSVYDGRLLGVTMDGKLVHGNRKGGFEIVGFRDLTLYSLKSRETGVYACTSKGLYRLETIGLRLILRSVLSGYPVTDMNVHRDCMYVATLHEGLKKIAVHG